MKKRILSLLLILALLPALSLPVLADSYNDVLGDAWYAGAVSYVSDHGLMTGFGNGRFAPEGTVTATAAGNAVTPVHLGGNSYLISLPGTEGLSVEDLSLRLDQAVPARVVREGKVFMNPEADFQIRETDKILVFSEESDSAILRRMEAEEMPEDLHLHLKTVPMTEPDSGCMTPTEFSAACTNILQQKIFLNRIRCFYRRIKRQRNEDNIRNN